MRMCPKCESPFSRAKVIDKIQQCPICSTEVYYKADGSTILLREKKCVDKVIEILTVACHKRDGVQPFPDYSVSSKERKFAYDLLGRCKIYLETQLGIGKDIGIGHCQFFVELIKHILSQVWWCDHLDSLLMLKNKIGQFAKDFFVIKNQEVLEARSHHASHYALAQSGFAITQ